MNQSIINTLTMLSDAMTTVEKRGQLASFAARAAAKGLGCDAVEIWLFVDSTRHGSRSEGAELYLASADTPSWRAWQVPLGRFIRGLGALFTSGFKVEQKTLADLTGDQVTTVAELAGMPSRVLRVSIADSDERACLAAGLFHADRPIGLLACTWAQDAEASLPDGAELLVACTANYLGQALGRKPESSPAMDLYLAGTGLLLTALDVGPPEAKQCAEVVARSTMKMAAGENLLPAEVQSLQWAALFHEVGQAPMDRWLTFPTSNGARSAAEPGSSGPPCLTLIPDLQTAANLLSQVAPVLNGQDGSLGSDVGLPAQLLAKACQSGHCRSASLSTEAATPNSDGELSQTEKSWDTHAPHIETPIPKDLNALTPEMT